MAKVITKNSVAVKIIAITALFIFCFILGGLVPILLPAFEGRYFAFLALPCAILILSVFLISPKFTFLAILLTRPSLDLLLDTTKIGGFGLGAVLNLVVILIALFQVINSKNRLPSILKEAWLPFILVSGFSLFYSPDLFYALKTYLAMLSYAAMFVIAILLIETKQDLDKWLRTVILSAVIPVLYAFVNIALGGFVSANTVVEGFRINSTFSHPNVFAFYLVLVMTLVFFDYKLNKSTLLNTVRYFIPVILLVLLGLLFLTKTRSAWIASVVFFIAYAFAYEKKYFIYITVVFLAALAIPEIRDRIIDLTQGNEVINYSRLNSYAWRKKIWGDALAWMEPVRYVYGYGLDGFRYFSSSFFSMSGGKNYGAHNVYVQLLFDTGFLGLLSYLWLHINVIRKSLSFYRTHMQYVFLSVALVIEYMFEAYSDNMLGYLAFNWYLWFLLGACFAAYRLQNGLSYEK